VRSSGDVAQAASAITAVVKRLDPNLPIEELETLPEQVRNNTYLDRMMTTLSAAFTVLATLLAAIGLYGVLAYTVAQRTREIGLRMALGAAPDRVRGMVLRQVAIMTLVGALAGLAGALAVGKAAQSMLFAMSFAFSTAVTQAVLNLSTGSPTSSLNTRASAGFFSPSASSCSHSKTARNRAVATGTSRVHPLLVVSPRSVIRPRTRSTSLNRSVPAVSERRSAA
jgi:predicted lysophospholipase L1 biosynthesis ABC-type transport system permease subunit